MVSQDCIAVVLEIHLLVESSKIFMLLFTLLAILIEASACTYDVCAVVLVAAYCGYSPWLEKEENCLRAIRSNDGINNYTASHDANFSNGPIICINLVKSIKCV